jgi:FkbM family methyltransferase
LRKVLREIFSGEAAARQPLRLALRFAKWQAWRRILRRPMPFRTLTGARLALLPGASGSLSGFWYQEAPDFEEIMFALHLVRPGDLFVDVGANQGGWSLSLAGAGARVLAFEPIPVTRGRLVANLAMNEPGIRSAVRVVADALGSEPGHARFTAGLDAGNHILRGDGESAADTVDVRIETLDAHLGDERPVLIKIDVEGEELGVLQGARASLERPSLAALIIETFRPSNHARPELVALEALLGDSGFQPMAYDPRTRLLRALREPSEGGQNTLYVRNPSSVSERLRSAPAVAALGRSY